MRINADGNVGIGTTNPTAYGTTSNTLEVRGASGTGTGLIRVSNANNTIGTSLYSSSSSGTLNVQTNHPLTFATNNNEKMRITSGGNVGIGRSSSITARLFVEGPVDTATISTSSTPAARINNGGAISNWIGSNGYNYGYIQSIQDDGSNNLKPLSLQPLGGNVGIGTTSPSQKLHVSGNLRVTGAYYDSNNSPGTANQVLVSTATGTDWVDGSGSSIIGGPYLPLAGNTTATAMTGDIFLANQQQVRFLTSGNLVGLRLQSSGTSSFIDNEVGDMYIRQEADGGNIFFQADDGSGGNDTYFSVRPNNGARTQFEKNTRHNDDVKAFFGTSEDLQIYHDGSNSYIADSGQGGVIILTNRFELLNAGGSEYMIVADDNSSVDLYYDNSKKLETTSTGITVTGDVQIDSALLSNQENTDVDTGAEVVAQVSTSTYTAAFFDFVIKKVGNIRSGTVYACHDGTNVEFTETSTQDLGDTSDVTLSVDISGGNMRLLATVISDDWSVKSLIRAI